MTSPESQVKPPIVYVVRRCHKARTLANFLPSSQLLQHFFDTVGKNRKINRLPGLARISIRLQQVLAC